MLKKIVFILSFLLCSSAYAEDMSIYETEVEVDAISDNAAHAREKAMNEANRKALYAVVNRISSSSSTQILDELNDNQILNFVQEVSVISEKVVDSRYLATLKITINAPIIKAYLAEKDAPITILPETHILIAPVFRNGETAAPELWQDNNPWYQSWAQNTMESGQITMHPIPSTSENKNLLQADDALQLNQMSLNAISKNNNQAQIYVADAVLNGNHLSVTLKSPNYGVIKTYTYEEGVMSFENAIQDIKTTLMEHLQQQSANQTTQQNKLTVVYQFNSLKEWLELRRFLETLSFIQQMDIDAMSGRRAQVTLTYTGTVDDIEKEFRANGFALTNSGNFYTAERI